MQLKIKSGASSKCAISDMLALAKSIMRHLNHSIAAYSNFGKIQLYLSMNSKNLIIRLIYWVHRALGTNIFPPTNPASMAGNITLIFMVTRQYTRPEIIKDSFCSFLSLLNFPNNQKAESLMLQNTALTYFTKSDLFIFMERCVSNLLKKSLQQL